MKRPTRTLLATGVAAVLVAGGTTPANGETRFVTDSYDKSAPAFNILHGRFSYQDESASFRVKFENLNRRKTSMVVRYYAANYTIQVQTKYVKGSKRIITHRITDTAFDRIPSKHVRVAWDFRKDVVRVVLHEPHLQGKRAGFHAWSQAKDALHGNHDGDYLMVPRLRRG